MNIRLIVPPPAIEVYGPRIAAITGGFTAFPGTGGWIDGTGKLVKEFVTVFDCYIPTDGYKEHSLSTGIDQFRNLARIIARNLNQHCVYLSFDGKVEYIK